MLKGTLALEPEARERLEQLFRACDTRGEGAIGRDELRELCSNLGLGREEAEALFSDLDFDGDGKIDFNDFVAGFREFVCPPESTKPPSSPVPVSEKERKKKEAISAWTDFLDQLNQSSTQVISKDRCKELETILRSTSSSPQLISCFDQVFRGLITDITRLQQENNHLEQTYKRERESHEQHLHRLEEEMEVQVQQMEKEIRQQARQEAEQDRSALKAQMDAEMAELQTHLKLFQSFDNWLKKDRTEDPDRVRRMQSKLEEAAQENRQLRLSVADMQTGMALLRSELAQMRTQYEEKCNELHKDKEVLFEYLHEHDHLTRQLHVLHEANKRLQDMNDSLRTAKDSAGLIQKMQTFRRPSDRLNRGSIIGDYLSQESANGETRNSDSDSVFTKNNKRHSTPLPEAENEVDQKASDIDEEYAFGINRFMEDLDSGLSTLRDVNELEENESLMDDEDKSKADEKHSIETIPIEEKISISSKKSDKSSSRFGNERSNPFSSVNKKSSVTDSCQCSNHLSSISPRRESLRPAIITSLTPVTLPLAEPTGPPERTYKVVFAGDASVGKSTFILRIVKGEFISTISSTLGVDFHVKTLRVDNINVTLQLWDTAGQERFRSITKSYFRRADGVMLLYDCTNEKSFLNVRHWMEAIDDVLEKNLPIMLCCNKIDLRETCGKTSVDKAAGERLARDFAAIYTETSAKDGQNVLDAIVQLTRQMAANEDLEVRTSGIEIGKNEPKKKNCCKSS